MANNTPQPSPAAIRAMKTIRELFGDTSDDEIFWNGIASLIDREFAPVREQRDKLAEAALNFRRSVSIDALWGMAGIHDHIDMERTIEAGKALDAALATLEEK